MSENERGTQESTDIETRTQRALREPMTVLPNTDPATDPTPVAGADGLVLVVSTGPEYVVDVEAGRCTCPDAEHRNPDGGCKHVRRARFATGRVPLPVAALEAVDADEHLGEHTDASLRFAAADGGRVVAGDDAEVLDNDEPGAAADGEECAVCAALDDGWACAECYIAGDGTIPSDGGSANHE